MVIALALSAEFFNRSKAAQEIEAQKIRSGCVPLRMNRKRCFSYLDAISGLAVQEKIRARITKVHYGQGVAFLSLRPEYFLCLFGYPYAHAYSRASVWAA